MCKINSVKRTNYTNNGIWVDRFGRSGVGSYEKVTELYNRLYVHYENGKGGEFQSSIITPEYNIIFIECIIDIIPAGTKIYESRNNGIMNNKYYSKIDEFHIIEVEGKIVAKGIIGYVFTKLNAGLYFDGYDYNSIPKIGTSEFYQYFFDLQFENFKKERPDGWRDDLIDEFLPFHIETQQKCISQSDELFTYFPKDEKHIVMQYVDNYLKFISQKYNSSRSNQQTFIPMNYKLILKNAITEFEEQKTPYQSFFKREAKRAERDNSVDLNDFFDGCLKVVENYKNEIKKQYKRELTKNDWVEESILSGNGMEIDGEHITDLSDERLQNILSNIKIQRDFIEQSGYESDDSGFYCSINKEGQITNDFLEEERKLYYPDLELLEKGIKQAKKNLSKERNNAKNPDIINNEQKQYKEINVEELKLYFKPTFKGIGENSINFFDSLINDLNTNWNPKEFAEIALMIYESNWINDRMPHHFNLWYTKFCNCVGCERKKYSPKDLKPIRESLQKLFSYLLLK